MISGRDISGVTNVTARRFPPPWSAARDDGQSPKSVISRTRFSFGFFEFPVVAHLPRIEASARTINPTTHRLRATVKNKKRNAIIKTYSIPRMRTSKSSWASREPFPVSQGWFLRLIWIALGIALVLAFVEYFQAHYH